MFCPQCGTWAPDEATHCQLCGASLRGDHLPPIAPGGALHATAPVARAALQYAGFWRRFAAVLVDSLVLWFPGATMRVILGLDPFAPFDPQTTTVWASVFFEYVLGWLYAALLISSPWRGTLGLLVMDLQVTDLHGERVSFGRASWRYLAQLLTLFTLGFGYLMQLATPRRQTLHDWVSRTVVIRTHPDVPAMHAPPLRMAP